MVDYRFILIVLITLFSASAYCLIFPLMPEVLDKFNTPSIIFSIIIISFPLGAIAANFFYFSLTLLIPKHHFLFMSILGETICILIFATLNLYKELKTVLSIAIIFRTLHGVFYEFTINISYSLTIVFAKKEELARNLSILDGIVYLGIGIGPLWASLFYYLNGYYLPYVAIGGIYFCLSFTAFCLKDKQEIKFREKQLINKEEERKKIKANLKIFIYSLGKWKILKQCLIIALNMISGIYFSPTLQNYMKNTFSFSVELSSVFFCITQLSSFLGVPIINILNKKAGISLIITIGILFSALGSLFIYFPGEILHTIIPTIIGLIVRGAVGSFCFVNPLLKVQEYMEKDEPDIHISDRSDRSTSLYTLSCAIGEIAGPIIGGAASTYLSNTYSSIIIGIILLIYTIVFIIFSWDEIKKEYKDGNYELKTAEDMEKEDKKSNKDYDINNSIKSINNDKENKETLAINEEENLNENDHLIS